MRKMCRQAPISVDPYTLIHLFMELQIQEDSLPHPLQYLFISKIVLTVWLLAELTNPTYRQPTCTLRGNLHTRGLCRLVACKFNSLARIFKPETHCKSYQRNKRYSNRHAKGHYWGHYMHTSFVVPTISRMKHLQIQGPSCTENCQAIAMLPFCSRQKLGPNCQNQKMLLSLQF